MNAGIRAAAIAAGLLLALARPAAAQIDLEGGWSDLLHEDLEERLLGPDIGEYEGLPINAAARFRAESWSASLWTVPEHQCVPHPADYGPNYGSVRIWKDVDPVTKRIVAYHTEMTWMNAFRTIWMDGREHPPEYAPHTWQGFSTGKWEGEMLTVTTTHLKAAYLRRNGLPRSDQATVLEHFIRNGDVLTWITIVTDPVFLTEPMIRSRNFYDDVALQPSLYACSVEAEVDRPAGTIPHHLPGANPFLDEHAVKLGLPLEATRGGAETMYPEFMERLRVLEPARAPATEAPPPAKGTKRERRPK